jgi:PAS domain S-box-containing protein
MHIPERDTTDNHDVTQNVTMPSLPDSGLSISELDALFDQSPIAFVLLDPQLRATRTNAAFRQIVGLPDEAIAGRRPSEVDDSVDVALIERILTEQVVKNGLSVADVPLVLTLAGKRRAFLWSARPVVADGQVREVLCRFKDVTSQTTSLRQAHALLVRADQEIGTTLDIRRTAGEFAALAVPELADRIAVDLSDAVLQGEDLPRPGSDLLPLRFCQVAGRDARTGAKFAYKTGDLITAPVATPAAVALSRGKPVLARNRAEIRRQGPYTAGHAEALLAEGVHTVMALPLIARDVTLGVAILARAENPEPYDEADVRLVSALAARAAVHIDNARLYTREHNTAVTLQRSLLPRDIPPVPGLDLAYRYQPASQAAEVGGDWFDVIALDRGQVALVVGDVAGHGVDAAAIMGQLRTTAATLARLGCQPEQIMRELSRVVADHGDEAGATCLYAVYDPPSRHCQLTSAGHLPPALRRPSGTVKFPDLHAGLLLGAGQDNYPATDIDLPAGSVLALYTDGLVEQPGQDITTGISRLASALAAGPTRSLDGLCDSMLATVAPHPRDDIALLLARPTAQTAR